jgi:hypothetical protein
MVDEPDEPPVAADRGNFWRNLLTPHRDEVDLILNRARQALQTADMALYSDYDPTGTERMRFYKEIYGMLKYARKLEPDNVEVLRLLGLTADEHGKTREAIEAFRSALDIAGDKAPTDIPGRLGIIYLRLGKLDDAIRYLRMAQGPVIAGQPNTAQVLVHLSAALAARGQMTEAIDVLSTNVPDTVQYFVNELLLVSFALAVQYDRDEQRGAAFDTLDKMQNVLQGQLATMGQQQLAGMRFSPPEDKHYYYALLYEACASRRPRTSTTTTRCSTRRTATTSRHAPSGRSTPPPATFRSVAARSITSRHSMRCSAHHRRMRRRSASRLPSSIARASSTRGSRHETRGAPGSARSECRTRERVGRRDQAR